MNKSYIKDIKRMIKNTMGRFILLILIIAIGVSFFVGIKSSSPILASSVETYNNKYNLMDILLYSTYGFDDNDIKEIRSIAGIEKVEGRNSIDVIALRNFKNIVIRIHDLKDDVSLNYVKLIQGRMIENDDEVLIEKKQQLRDGYNIGDIINVKRDDDKIKDFLKHDTFKVVGIIETPYYLNHNKGFSNIQNLALDSYMYVKDSVFINDFYTEVAIKTDYNKNTFDKEYTNYINNIKDKIEDLATSQINNRKEIVIQKANEKYNDGLNEYKENKEKFDREIADGEKKINDAKNKIIKNEKDILDGNKKIENAKIELNNNLIKGRKEIEDKRNELGLKHADLKDNKEKFKLEKSKLESNLYQINVGISEIDSGIEQVDTALLQVNNGINEVKNNLNYLISLNDPSYQTQIDFLSNKLNELNTQKSSLEIRINELNLKKSDLISKKDLINNTINETEYKINDGLSQIEKGFEELVNASVKLDNIEKDTLKEIEEKTKELKEAKIKIDDAKKELEKNEIKFNEEKQDGIIKLEDANNKLVKAKQEIDDLYNGEWFILTKEKQYSSKTFIDTVKQMEIIGNVFPLFFFLVASLVCLTTITRMIDEQRVQIGIYIALGYSKFAVYLRYIIYTLLSSIIGGLIGSIFGLLLFPPVIYNSWKMMYNLPIMSILIPYKLIFISISMFSFIMVSTAIIVCRSEINDTPASLLRFKNEASGKKILIEKISFVWNKLKFTTKITLRNILRYKKRFFMTIIGIAGCSALLITGFGIRDSISSIVNIQFKEIYKYEGSLSVDNIDNVLKQIKKINEINNINTLFTYSDKVNNLNLEEVVNVHVVDKDEINNIYNLRKRNSNKKLILDDNGVIISEKLSKKLNVKINDYIELTSNLKMKKSFKVLGIMENYVYHNLFISNKLYKQEFMENINDNTITFNVIDDFNKNKLLSSLTSIEDIKSVSFFDSILDNFNSMIKGLNAVIYVIIFSSTLLAIVVLGNLTSINIEERKREIATLKVLGFTFKEINMYIFNESILLTLIGALLGIPLGLLLHKFIITLVEVDYVMFGRNVELFSMFISILLTLIFSIIVSIIMSRRIKNIEMVESLKSIE